MLSAGWAGGTRIGDCVAAFNRQHTGRLVHPRTAIIIASDGYGHWASPGCSAARCALWPRAPGASSGSIR